MHKPYRLISKSFVFVTVVEEGSFTAAADRLGLGKAVVSRHITELERSLGTKLLSRDSRRLSLTGAGQKYYSQLAELPKQMQRAISELDAEQSELRGSLRIAAPGDFGVHFVVPRVSEFLVQHPSIDLDLHCDDDLIDLNRHNIDVSFQVGEPRREDRVVRKLMCSPHKVYVSAATAKKYGPLDHPEALLNRPAVTLSLLEHGTQWQFKHPRLGTHSLKLNQRIRVNTVSAMRAFILSQAALGILPEVFARDAVKSGELVSVLDEWQLPGVDVFMSYRSPAQQPARVKRFIEFMREAND